MEKGGAVGLTCVPRMMHTRVQHTYVRTYVRAGVHVREVTRGWVGISDIYGQYFRFSCRYRSPYQFNMSAIKNWIKLYPHLATVSTR